MAYICYREDFIGCHEVVVLQVCGDVNIGPCAACFADQRSPGAGADRHAAHRGSRRVAVPYDLHAEFPPDKLHKLHGVNGFWQFAHYAESHALAGFRGLQHPEVSDAQYFGPTGQLIPSGALSRLVWQA